MPLPCEAAENGLSPNRENRTSEPATGHDSPTSILCLQCPSRVLFFRTQASRAGLLWASVPTCSPLMGLQEHEEVLKAAEERLQSLKVSL